jgi:hypothetical protein
MKTCLAPDSNPTKPTQILPEGAWDAHCHVFGPAAEFPYAEDRSYTPPDAPFETLRSLHDHLGFTRLFRPAATVVIIAQCWMLSREVKVGIEA